MLPLCARRVACATGRLPLKGTQRLLCRNVRRCFIVGGRIGRAQSDGAAESSTGRHGMSTLNIGIEIRDFDLERMGFSLSVLDDSKKRQASEAYLRSEEHTSELQSPCNLVCRLLLEKKNTQRITEDVSR